jgi:membrane associated rhomboid family serine protease
MSRATETVSKIPLSTLSFGAICVATYCFQILLNPKNHDYTMNPRQVIFMHQYYRIITSAFFHGSLMHIGFNMLSLMAVGKSLERHVGSLFTTFTILWSVLLTSAIYIFIALAAHLVGSDKLMNQHSLGFSGVLFHILVLESSRNPNSSQAVFGMMRVSSKVYPWVMLVVIQFLMPNISFLGHLSGILAGTLQSGGQLNVIMPSADYLRSCDESQRLQFAVSKPNYIKTASNDVFAVFSSPSDRSGISSGLAVIFKFIRDLLETIKVMIFGRGEGGNANIRFGTEENVSLNVLSAADDDGWIGIPPVPPIRESEVV